MTIQRNALIDQTSGIVLTIHVVDTEGDYAAEEGLLDIACPDNVGPGFVYAAGPPATWTAPAPPVVAAPTEFYLSKVYFEARLPDPVFEAFDAIRIQVLNRPADWATNQSAPWPTLYPYVRPILKYDAAISVNVLDPSFPAIFTAMQATNPVFGADAATASALMASILDPSLHAGETDN